jgi:hypothetical protein
MTRKIELKTVWAGPEGVRQAGFHTLPESVAKGLVDSKQAEYADGLPPELAIAAAPVQTAAVKPPEVAKAIPAAKVVTEPAQAEVKINLAPPAGWGKGA